MLWNSTFLSPFLVKRYPDLCGVQQWHHPHRILCCEPVPAGNRGIQMFSEEQRIILNSMSSLFLCGSGDRDICTLQASLWSSTSDFNICALKSTVFIKTRGEYLEVGNCPGPWPAVNREVPRCTQWAPSYVHSPPNFALHHWFSSFLMLQPFTIYHSNLTGVKMTTGKRCWRYYREQGGDKASWGDLDGHHHGSGIHIVCSYHIYSWLKFKASWFRTMTAKTQNLQTWPSWILLWESSLSNPGVLCGVKRGACSYLLLKYFWMQ